MFLVLEDDDCVHVYPSAECAAKAIEGLDVEEAARRAFDEKGPRYRVEWLVPNSHGKILGLIPWSVNGKYRFVPDGVPEPAELAKMLSHARAIFPTEMAAVVSELRTRLSGG